MQQLTLWMQMSLDGYGNGPGGAFDWPVLETDLQWHMIERLEKAGGFVYGRRVFEMMAGFWPTADTVPGLGEFHAEFARIWRPMPKFVVSRSLERADWNSTVLPGGDGLAEQVERVKEQDGAGLYCFGGPQLATQLAGHGLVDVYQLFVHPVVLGGGAKIFADLPARLGLALAEARTFGGGVVSLRYEKG